MYASDNIFVALTFQLLSYLFSFFLPLLKTHGSVLLPLFHYLGANPRPRVRSHPRLLDKFLLNNSRSVSHLIRPNSVYHPHFLSASCLNGSVFHSTASIHAYARLFPSVIHFNFLPRLNLRARFRPFNVTAGAWRLQPRPDLFAGTNVCICLSRHMVITTRYYHHGKYNYCFIKFHNSAFNVYC